MLLGGLALAAALGFGVQAAFGIEDRSSVPFGMGLLIGAAAVFGFGWWINIIRPQQRAQAWIQERSAQLQQLVATDRFQAVPGMVPASRQEAQAGAQAMLEQESAVVRTRGRNIHTVFWIPVQWIGIVLLGLGIMLIVSG